MSLIIKTIYQKNPNFYKNSNNHQRLLLLLTKPSSSSNSRSNVKSLSSSSTSRSKSFQNGRIFNKNDRILQTSLLSNQSLSNNHPQSKRINTNHCFSTTTATKMTRDLNNNHTSINDSFLSSSSSSLFFSVRSRSKQSRGLKPLQQLRGAKMWVSPPKRKRDDQDKDRMGPLLDCLRLVKATTIINQLKLDQPIKFRLQPNLKKTVNSNVMRGRLFLPNQLPKDTSSIDQNDPKQNEVLVVIWSSSIDHISKEDLKLSKSLGIDHIGGKELVEQIVNGNINPTKLLCHPDQLPLLVRDSKVARVLGPRGLIPSEKRGTVSADLTRLVQDAKGALDWVMDPTTGLVTAELGKVSMDLQAVEQNLLALSDTIGDIAQGGQGVLRAFKSGRPIKHPGIKRVTLEVSGLPQIIVT